MELSGKKVLVTGAEGFIGSHLVERLLEEGCGVRAMVLYNFSNSWGWLDTLTRESRERIEVFPGDVRDPQNVKKAVEGTRAVFHLAALIGIPFSYSSPSSYVDTNIKGTLNVLQSALEAGSEKVIVTSTSEVYGTARHVPIDEGHPRQPQSPYSATKISADSLAGAYRASFSLPVTIVRPFNTYGPRQSARAVIPTIITQLLSGQKSLRLGALHPRRDLVYVTDTAEGFIRAARSEAATGEDVNIATGREVSVKELAEKLKGILGSDAEIVEDSERLRPPGSEVDRLMGDPGKLRSLTGWEPSTGLDEGLEMTVSWFRNEENRKIYKHGIYNV